MLGLWKDSRLLEKPCLPKMWQVKGERNQYPIILLVWKPDLSFPFLLISRNPIIQILIIISPEDLTQTSKISPLEQTLLTAPCYPLSFSPMIRVPQLIGLVQVIVCWTSLLNRSHYLFMCNIFGTNKSIDNHRIKLLSTWNLMKQENKTQCYIIRIQSDGCSYFHFFLF